MDVIKNACDQGIVIVAISQCARGSVNNSYAAGHTLAATGVVAGADMTPEVLCVEAARLTCAHSTSPGCTHKALLPFVKTRTDD